MLVTVPVPVLVAAIVQFVVQLPEPDPFTVMLLPGMMVVDPLLALDPTNCQFVPSKTAT